MNTQPTRRLVVPALIVLVLGMAVPAWPQFLRGCLRYRESLDRELPDAPRLRAEYEGEHGRKAPPVPPVVR